MRGGNVQANGQPWSKKQRKASRFHNKIRNGGFNRTPSTMIDLKSVGAVRGMLAGLLGMMFGRRKKV